MIASSGVSSESLIDKRYPTYCLSARNSGPGGATLANEDRPPRGGRLGELAGDAGAASLRHPYWVSWPFGVTTRTTTRRASSLLIGVFSPGATVPSPIADGDSTRPGWMWPV